MRSTLARLTGGLAGLAAAVLLAACSSTLSTDTPQTGLPPDTIADAFQLGSGPTKVALIVRDQTDDLADGAPNSTYLAARLAADIVAKAPITLLVRHYDGSGKGLQAVQGELSTQDVKLVVGPDDEAVAARLAGAFGRKGATVITLTGVAAPEANLFSFAISGETEASLMADEMRRRGYRNVALVSNPSGTASVFTSLLATAITAAKITVTPVDGVDPSAAASQIAAAPAPSAIVFVESPAAAGAVLKKLRGQGLFSQVAAVGPSAWAFNASAAAGLGPGWYLAPDGSSISGFTTRFAAAYGQPPTPDGALVYDLLVLAAALPQVFPDKGYSPEILTNDQGFVGATGKFWFTSDGQVHRKLSAVDLPNAR